MTPAADTSSQPIRHGPRLWYLLPHALSLLFFAAAFAWMWSVGTNRTLPDLYLAVGGYVALAAALIGTVAAVVDVLRNGAGLLWPWLVAHLAAVLGLLAVGFAWLGAHLV